LSGFFPDPDISDVREAVARCFPSLPAGEVSFAGRGWDFVAYRAGDFLLRVPRHDGSLARLPLETRLLSMLASRLPAPIPVIERQCDDGPNGLPLTGYRLVPGTPIEKLEAGDRLSVARDLGAFLRALHAVPVELGGVEAGLKAADAASWRRDIEAEYESVCRDVFPLLSAEAQRFGESVYERFLADEANFPSHRSSFTATFTRTTCSSATMAPT
jgi:aminoglycoside phosphotransferase (APT) family kinase protein